MSVFSRVQYVSIRSFSLEESTFVGNEHKNRNQQQTDKDGQNNDPNIQFVLLMRPIRIGLCSDVCKVICYVFNDALLWIHFDNTLRRDCNVLNFLIVLKIILVKLVCCVLTAENV
jgi:hypothetical protein